MAPQQLESGTIDARTDIFAFGLILYEMITGRAAFRSAQPATVIGDILHSNPTPITSLVPSVPSTLVSLITTCLAKDRNERWSSAHDLMLQLRALRHDEDVPAFPSGPVRRTREWLPGRLPVWRS